MKLIDQYIGGTVLANILVVLSILLSLFIFFAFIDELQDVGKGKYSVTDAFQYTLMTVPRLFYEVFPIAALLGTIVGLGLLANNSELTVIRAAGVSLRRISWSVMRVGLALIVVVLLVGEWLAPIADKSGQVSRSVAMSGKFSYRKSSGLWARDGLDFINIREILAGQRLGGIVVFEFGEDNQLKKIIRAQEAVLRKHSWLLQDVEISRFFPERVDVQTMPEQEWKTTLSPELLDIVTVKPNTLSVFGLYQYVSYLHDNGLNAERYELAMWNKLISPVITAVMIFLAVPFVFGPLRSVSVGQRILVGALVGIGFHLFNRVFNYLTLVFEFDPLVSAVTPTIIFSVIAYFLMKRVR